MNPGSLPPSVFDYVERPKSCSRTDYWDQVRRTVNGKPPSAEQMGYIYEHIRSGCNLNSKDALLDLCCGNGRLGSEFFHEISSYLGVDYSEYLINIAKEDFERAPTHIFSHMDVLRYLDSERNPERFTKCLIFGSISYFSLKEIDAILKLLYIRFVFVSKVFISPIPDCSKAHLFFNKEVGNLTDHTSSLGRWFSRDEFKSLAVLAGWNCELVELPVSSHQSHYRFSACLTR